MNAKTLSVDVWSDIACPWCFVGKRRLAAALERFAHQGHVEVTWHAFELDREAPPLRDRSVSYAARIAAKYGMPVAQAEDKIRQMAEVARADGLDFHFEKVQSGNTFDAHRVIHLAHERGVQDAVKERLLLAYMTEGAAISDHATLIRLGAEAGLDGEEVRAVLASDRYAREVRADEAAAVEMGISGVPFFVVGGRYGVSGAQPAEALLRVLEKAWSELEPASTSAAEGSTCGPEGCA